MKEELSTVGLGSSAFQPGLPSGSFIRAAAKGLLIFILAFLLVQFAFIHIKNFNKKLQWNKNLYGTQNNRHITKPVFTWNALFSGEWQKAFEAWFNVNSVPFRSTIIKLHNQFYYTFFWKSYMGTSAHYVVVGKDRYLYRFGYLNKYYNLKRQTPTQNKIDAWADHLKALNDFFQRRGQMFIYTITPSKASHYPEYLPQCKRCDPSSTQAYYKAYVATLKEKGLPFFDASEMTLNAKKDFPNLLFPKGGVHWTQLASTLAARGLIQQMAQKYALPELQFTYRVTNELKAGEDDAANLLNLISPPKGYLVPEVSIKRVAQRNGKKLKVAIISGSFMYAVSKAFAQSGLFDQIDLFFYWKMGHYRNTPTTEPDASSVIGMTYPFDLLDIEAQKTYQAILSADVVILEEGETRLDSNHFEALRNFIYQIQSTKT